MRLHLSSNTRRLHVSIWSSVLGSMQTKTPRNLHAPVCFMHRVQGHCRVVEHGSVQLVRSLHVQFPLHKELPVHPVQRRRKTRKHISRIKPQAIRRPTQRPTDTNNRTGKLQDICRHCSTVLKGSIAHKGKGFNVLSLGSGISAPIIIRRLGSLTCRLLCRLIHRRNKRLFLSLHFCRFLT